MEQNIRPWLAEQSSNITERSKDFIGSRHYKHFDSPISLERFTNSSSLQQELVEHDALTKHKYWPFIRNDKFTTRYNYNSTYGRNWQIVKDRPIMYASHRDAIVFSFYGYTLKKIYEEKIKNTYLTQEVIAYRRIPTESNGKNKCNVDFADEAFEYIHNYSGAAVVFCLDIKNFFGTMDHKLLCKGLNKFVKNPELMERLRLVLKPIMRYRYVFRKDIEKTYGKKSVWNDSQKYNKHIRKSELIHKNKSRCGIPQGSPISDILSNIYLYDFDYRLSNYLEKIDGDTYYRRYCDDIFIVVPVESARNLYAYVHKMIKELKLSLSTRKTEAFLIDSSDRSVKNISQEYSESSQSRRKEIQYLGFSFDMDRIFIRSKSVENTYKKARNIRRNAEKKARNKNDSQRQVHNRSIYQYARMAQRCISNASLNRQVRKIRKRTKVLLRG